MIDYITYKYSFKKYILFFILIFSLITFSCSSAFNYPQFRNSQVFEKGINSILKQYNFNASIGIKVVSLKNNKTLFEKNSSKLFTPASNLKLFTLSSALELLGPDYSFKTVIGVENNNISLIGGGDPTFTSKNLDSLAAIVSSKLQRIDTLFIDATMMDNLDYGNGWMWDEGSEEFSAAISAITVNNNCINFEYSPSTVGKPTQINFFPNSENISIVNNSVTVDDTINFSKFRIDRDWINQSNDFIISGEVLIDSQKDTLKKNIYKPQKYNADLFVTFLNSYGIDIGQIKFKKNKNKMDTIAVHKSRHLSDISKVMMFESNNQIAELFLKTIGFKKYGIGSSNKGSTALKTFIFNEAKIDTNFLRISDGSGLSRYNLLNANQIIELLIYMDKSICANDFKKILPNGGSKNSRLEDRLVNTGTKIKAKTGSLSGVSSFSGYIISDRHGPLAFSILINGFTGPSQPYRDFQDQICKWLIKL